MKANKLLPGCLAVLALFLSACSTPPAPVSDTASPEPESPYIEAGTNHTSVPTTVYVATNPAGQVVTVAKGKQSPRSGRSRRPQSPIHLHPVPPPLPAAVSRQTVTHTAMDESSADGTTDRQPDSTTASHARTTTVLEAKATATSRVTTTQQPTKTASQPKPSDPWRYPYDLQQIYAACKLEIERLGMVWKDELRPENSAWANPESTVPNTYFPEECYLRDDVFKMIQYYHDTNTRKYCRIWFEPHPDSPGDYYFYFLEEY